MSERTLPDFLHSPVWSGAIPDHFSMLRTSPHASTCTEIFNISHDLYRAKLTAHRAFCITTGKRSCGDRVWSIRYLPLPIESLPLPYPLFVMFPSIEDVHAMIGRDRSGLGSSLWSIPPRNRAGTSPASQHFRRLLQGPGAGSSNRRSGRPACRSI